MENKLDREEDEKCLEYAKHFKKHLRFELGETVFLKSDKNKKAPMTISKILIFDDDDDYYLIWMNSQKTIEGNSFCDKILMQ